MATFNNGDWVQITFQPDKKWGTWVSKSTFYNNFLGKIGEITDISEEDNTNKTLIYRVRVDFPYQIKDENIIFDTGSYFCWFKAEHLKRSSKSAAERAADLQKAAAELQEWENFKKKTTDDMLKHIFGPSPKEEQKEQPKVQDDWEEKTPIMRGYYDYDDTGIF